MEAGTVAYSREAWIFFLDNMTFFFSVMSFIIACSAATIWLHQRRAAVADDIYAHTFELIEIMRAVASSFIILIENKKNEVTYFSGALPALEIINGSLSTISRTRLRARQSVTALKNHALSDLLLAYAQKMVHIHNRLLLVHAHVSAQEGQNKEHPGIDIAKIDKQIQQHLLWLGDFAVTAPEALDNMILDVEDLLKPYWKVNFNR